MLKLKKILNKVKIKLMKSSKNNLADSSEVTRWFRDNGDKTLRLEYDLNNTSVVLDVGGFEGQWSSDIFSRYLCTIYIFEPVKTFYEKIHKMFIFNEKILVFNSGLSDRNSSGKIFIDKDSSSIYKTQSQGEEQVIEFLMAVDFLKNKKIEIVDLIKINIEGGEYDLLYHLIESEYIENIKNIQVQFHDFVDNAEEKMTEIQKLLERTHYLTYQYRFVWENWALKKEYDPKTKLC